MSPSTTPNTRSRITGVVITKYSRSASAVAIATSPHTAIGFDQRMARIRSGASPAAVSSLAARVDMGFRWSLPPAGDLLASASEASFPALIGLDGCIELASVEIGPKSLGEVKLGIGRFPKQKIRDAQLARGANDKVRLRQHAGAQMRLHDPLVDRIG